MQRYRARVSGPLLDRIDMHVEVPRPDAEEITRSRTHVENSAEVAVRVLAARERQRERAGIANAHLDNRDLERACAIDGGSTRLIRDAMRKLGLSG